MEADEPETVLPFRSSGGVSANAGADGRVFVLSPITVYREAILDEVRKLHPQALGFASLEDLRDHVADPKAVIVLVADVLDDPTRLSIAALHELFERLQLVLLAGLGDARINDFSGATPLAALLPPDSSLDMLNDALALIGRSNASVVPRAVLDSAQPGAVKPLADNPLSPREVDVIVRLTHGRSNKEIARDLLMAEPTVRAHIRSILVKLNFHNRTQATVWAIRNGLDQLPEAPKPKAPPSDPSDR